MTAAETAAISVAMARETETEMVARKADWVTAKMPHTAETGSAAKRPIPAMTVSGRWTAATAGAATAVTGDVEAA